MKLYYTTEYDGGNTRELLYKAASVYIGADVSAYRIDRAERGKPFFPDLPHIHFNITHSCNVWMCAFSDGEVGVDLQKHVECVNEDMARAHAGIDDSEILRISG